MTDPETPDLLPTTEPVDESDLVPDGYWDRLTERFRKATPLPEFDLDPDIPLPI